MTRSLLHIRVMLTLLIAMLGVPTVMARTAAEDIAACAKKLRSAGGLQAQFYISGPQGNSSGQLKASGQKFMISAAGVSTWYDGKNMWSYNPRTSETTLVTPSAAEIAEANPLAYLSTVSGYTAAYKGSGTASVRQILLTPKSKRGGIKTVLVTLDTRTMLPSQMEVNPTSGGKYVIRIKGAKVGMKFAPSTFVYPKGSYPKAKIIDLR